MSIISLLFKGESTFVEINQPPPTNNNAINKPKTVRYDLRKQDIKFILEKMKILEERFTEYLDIIKKDKVTKERLENVGIIPKQKAKRYCLVGPTARASGFNNDIRVKHPYDAYPYLDFDSIVSKQGDAYARMTLRLMEVFESIKIISPKR